LGAKSSDQYSMLQKNPAAQLLLLPPSIGRETHFLQTAQECKWNDEEEDKSDRKWKEECEGQKGDDDSAEGILSRI